MDVTGHHSPYEAGEFPESNTEIVPSGRYWELPERLKNGEIDLYFGYYRDDLDSLMFHEMFLDSVCIAYVFFAILFTNYFSIFLTKIALHFSMPL